MGRRKNWPEKIQWMIDHVDLWNHVVIYRERWKREPTSLYMSDRATWKGIADGLKRAGLMSKTNATIDVPVKQLILEAREEMAKRNERNI